MADDLEKKIWDGCDQSFMSDEEEGKEESAVLPPLPALRRLNDGLLLECDEEEELETNLRPKFAAGGDGF